MKVVKLRRRARHGEVVDAIPARKVSTTTKEKREATGFVRLPVALAMLLGEHPPVLIVACFLLWRRHLQEDRWKQGRGMPITVSNIELQRWGISRGQKARALAELETHGLIRIELQENGKAPAVVLVGSLWDG